MPFQAKISLPGYDVFTDTNLDHFSLFTDSSNELIKEFVRGSTVLVSGGSTTITHNLGYIPFFYASVYGHFIVNSVDTLAYLRPGSGGAIEVPEYVAFMDTSKLTLQNNSGNNATFWYYIFYDQQL